VAALLERRFAIEPDIVPGDRREFSVAVNGKIVARKHWMFFPLDPYVVAAVGRALKAGAREGAAAGR